MKKQINPNKKFKLVTVFILFILISCDGQRARKQIKTSILQRSETTNQIEKQISQVVRMMFQDSKGQIWFGTQGGAFRLSNGSLIHIDGIVGETGKGVTIKDIAEDRDGNIWIGHTDGVSKIEGQKVSNYYESHGLISNDVWSIETDSKGNIWIGTIDGVCLFDGQKFTNFDLPEGKIDTDLGISSTKMIHCIMEDSNEAIWLCTNAGLFKYADNVLTNVSSKVGIQAHFINEITERKEDTFLVSTKDALYEIQGDQAINITNKIPEMGKGVGSVADDKDGKLWFVLNQHQLYTFDGEHVDEFKKSEDNKGPAVFQIYKDQKDRLWFVGYGGAYRLENGKFINITIEGPW